MNTRFLFILSPSPRCGTNFVFDVLSLDRRFRAQRIDEDHFIAGFSAIEKFLAHSVERSSLSKNEHEPLKAEMRLAISTALMETCGAAEGVASDTISLFKTPTTRGLTDAFTSFPDSCRFLVIVRNGRDVIESFVQSFPWTNFAYAFHRWRSGCKELFKAESLGSDRLLRIHYEDLLNSPIDTVTKILQWLDLPVEPFPFQLIESLPVRGSSESRISGRPVSWAPTMDPFAVRPDQRSSSATRWRRFMFNAYGERWNVRLGYAGHSADMPMATRSLAGVLYFFEALKYRLRPSLRDLANRDIGGTPPLLP